MNPIEIAVSLFVLLFAITVHEAAHGWAAKRMGDTTAYDLGRVSLNPLAHIDPVGTVLLPLMLVLVGAPAFGWAKPVPGQSLPPAQPAAGQPAHLGGRAGGQPPDRPPRP